LEASIISEWARAACDSQGSSQCGFENGGVQRQSGFNAKRRARRGEEGGTGRRPEADGTWALGVDFVAAVTYYFILRQRALGSGSMNRVRF